MHTGMLWFDSTQSDFAVKLSKAMEYYEKKYGRKPDLCLVHPATAQFPDGVRSAPVNGITVRLYRPVLPGHIWVGIADKDEA